MISFNCETEMYYTIEETTPDGQRVLAVTKSLEEAAVVFNKVKYERQKELKRKRLSLDGFSYV